MHKLGLILKDDKEQQTKIRKFISFVMQHNLCRYDSKWNPSDENEQREDIRVTFDNMPICLLNKEKNIQLYCQLENLSAGGCKLRVEHLEANIQEKDLVEIFMPFINLSKPIKFQILRIL